MVNFICGNLFKQIAGKIAKIRTRKNFVPHYNPINTDNPLIWALFFYGLFGVHIKSTFCSSKQKFKLN